MRIAFVHDRVLTIGWAEKVFFQLVQLNKVDESEIFTVFSDKNFVEIDWKKIKINALIKNNFLISKIGYRNLMPFFPILTFFLWRKIKKYNPQKTIISSFAIAKNINTYNSISQLYLHSPMQYIWDSYDEYIEKFQWIKKIIFILSAKCLRSWDKRFTKFSTVEFNSEYTQQLAKEIYNIEWKVKYPPIPQNYLNAEINTETKDYYIYIWRIVKFSKEVDKIIQLFNSTWDKLVIIWSWPDEIELKKISNSNIKYLWYIFDDNEICRLLKQSKWLINITKESYWIVTAQSLACWIPVFGYNQWQTKYLVNEIQWLLLNNKELGYMIKQFEIFKNTKYNKQDIKNIFLKMYKNWINPWYNER